MRHKFTPLIGLILAVLLLLAGNMYVTRHAFKDMTQVLMSQRTHYKYIAMNKMAVHYYTQQDTSQTAFTNFLEGTIASPEESYFLATYEPNNGFPIVWSHTTPEFAKYQDIGSIEKVARYSDSTGATPYNESIVFLDALKAYNVADQTRPIIITNHITEQSYLLVWTIIETPSPSGAKYVYYSFTPTKSVTGMADDIHDKYLTLFVISVCLAASMLILIPMTVQRFI